MQEQQQQQETADEKSKLAFDDADIDASSSRAVVPVAHVARLARWPIEDRRAGLLAALGALATEATPEKV
jgi:hypothetical protein